MKLNTSSKENLDDLEVTIDENEIYPSAKHIKAELLKDRSKKFGRFYQLVVRITIPKDCPNSSFIGPEESNYGKLVFRTNHPTAKTINILVNFSKILQGQSRLLTRLLTSLESGNLVSRGAPVGNKKVACFECGGPHYKRNCPNLRGPKRTPSGQNNQGVGPATYRSGQGNANGPAQV